MKKLILPILIFKVLIYTSCQSNKSFNNNSSVESFKKQDLQIKTDACEALEKRVASRFQESGRIGYLTKDEDQYYDDYINIQSELDANRFITKYHSDVINFYSDKYEKFYISQSLNLSATQRDDLLNQLRTLNRIEDILTRYILEYSRKLKKDNPSIIKENNYNKIKFKFLEVQKEINSLIQKVQASKSITNQERNYWKELKNRFSFYKENYPAILKEFEIDLVQYNELFNGFDTLISTY